MSNKKIILITGAHGQVGLQCIESMSQGREFEPLSYPHKEFDICDRSSIEKIFRKDFSAVINCAAYTAVDMAQTETEKAWASNALAPKLLSIACASKEVPLIHFSTDYVYDNGLYTPLKESDPCNPKSIYAISKYIGEQEALYYHDSTLIIRTSWVYSRNGQNFVNTIRKLASERDVLNIVHDQIGAPTYTPDLVGSILQILYGILQGSGDKNSFGIYNYSNSGAISWYEFAQEILRFSPHKCQLIPVPTTSFPRPAHRAAFSVFDLSKIQNSFGTITRPWQEALADCLQKD